MNDKSTMQPSSLLAGDTVNDNNSISSRNSQSSFQDFPNCDDDDSDDSLHSQNSIMSEIVINNDDTVKGPPIHLFTEATSFQQERRGTDGTTDENDASSL